MERLFMNIPISFIQGPNALEVKGVCINYLNMGHACMVGAPPVRHIALPYSLPKQY